MFLWNIQVVASDWNRNDKNLKELKLFRFYLKSSDFDSGFTN